MKFVFAAKWFQFEDSGSWTVGVETDDPHPTADASSFPADFVRVSAWALARYREQIAAAVEGRDDDGYVAGADGVNVGFRGGVFVLTHDYYSEGAETLISSEDLVRLIDWRIAIIESDDFNNPDADFGSIEVDLEIRDRSES